VLAKLRFEQFSSPTGHCATFSGGTVAADEPTVVGGDHRSGLNPNGLVGAANDQLLVGRSVVCCHVYLLACASPKPNPNPSNTPEKKEDGCEKPLIMPTFRQ
jgi:hypothetical protein